MVWFSVFRSMWPFVLHRETLELPAPLYEVRGRIATWLNETAATSKPWTGVVNREMAHLGPATQYTGGQAIASYRLIIRFVACGPGDGPVPRGEHTRLQIRAVNRPDEGVFLLAMLLFVAAGASGWWAAVREGRVPWDWRAVSVLCVFPLVILLFQWSLRLQARAALRHLAIVWTPAPSARTVAPAASTHSRGLSNRGDR